MKKLIFAFFFLSLSPVYAADLYNFRNLGFSPDGRYYAYANSVVQDGSGFPHASVYLMNVAKNSLVRSATLTIKDDSSYEESDALRRVLPQMHLEAFRIYPGQNLGVELALTQSHSHQATFTDNGRKYALDLVESDAGNESQRSYCKDAGRGSKLIALALTDLSSQRRIVLEDEHVQPKSRYCSFDFKLEKVLRFNGKIAVALSYQSPGFEGPDTKYKVITAKLP